MTVAGLKHYIQYYAKLKHIIIIWYAGTAKGVKE